MIGLRFFFWAQCFIAPPSPLEINRAIDHAQRGPTLLEFQQAALAQAKPKLRSRQRWLKRARASAAMPTVSIQLERRDSRDWDLNKTGGLFDSQSIDRGNTQGIRVRAAWDLSFLVFNPVELRVAHVELDLLDWQKELLVEVTQLYFERIRLFVSLQFEGRDSPNTPASRQLESQLRILEIQGMLMALTGLDWETSHPPLHTIPRPPANTNTAAIAPNKTR